MLPNVIDCDFFKKATLFNGGKTEKAFIFKLKSEQDYTFIFACPKCGGKNDFHSELVMKEVKEGGKKTNFIVFNCKKCSAEFNVEKFKVKKIKKGKDA